MVISLVDFNFSSDVRIICSDKPVISASFFLPVTTCPFSILIPRYSLHSRFARIRRWMNRQNVAGSSCHLQFSIALCIFTQPSLILYASNE